MSTISAIGTNVCTVGGSAFSWSSYWAEQSVFMLDKFNFITNQLLDSSGNNNHATLKGASARKGDGGDLDYLITGLLTTDTVEVVSGSDTPTIPINGTLRIGAAQTVYGVTIKRAGETWAVIPFCEPIFEGFVPLKSYDVSGNRRHASCAGLVEGNITTQDNYFYLMEHGYTYGEQLHEDYDLEDDVSGVPKNWTAGADYFTMLKSTWMGDYWRFEYNDVAIGFGANFYKSGIDALAVPNTYFLVKSLRRINQVLYVGQTREDNWGYIKLLTHRASGTYYLYNTFTPPVWPSGPTNNILDGTASEWISDMSFFRTSAANDRNYFAVNPYINGDTETPTIIDLKRIVICLPYIVPAELDGITSATGFEIEIVQDGSRLLRYAGSLQFADTPLNAATKPIYSPIIKTGILENGESYLVESDADSLFGAALHETFVSNGTEKPDKDNAVRKELDASLLYTGVNPKLISYNDIFEWNPHLSYAEKTRDYINKLIIIKGDVFITNIKHTYMLSNLTLRESIRGKYLAIWFDHPGDDKFDTMADALDVINVKVALAINYLLSIPEAKVTIYHDEGHEITVHSQTALATYKGWFDTLAFYTEAELRAYYAECISYHESKGWGTPHCKVYPGGGYSKITTEIASEYFLEGRKVGQLLYTNEAFTDNWYKKWYDYAKYKKWYKIGAISTDDLAYNVWKTDIDKLIALSEGFGGLYIHLSIKDIVATYDDDGNVDGGGETFIEKIIKLFNYCAANGVRVITPKRVKEIASHIDLP